MFKWRFAQALRENNVKKIELLLYQYIYASSSANLDLFRMTIQMRKLDIFMKLLKWIPFEQTKAPGLILLAIGSRWKCNDVRKLAKILNVVPSDSSVFASIVLDRPDILQLLIEEFNVPSKQKSQTGETPLQVATRLNRIRCTTYLKTIGMKKTQKEKEMDLA
ncbi:unnamed protein product [Ceutorhynchus assimilis]|uniref:Uncharacterized protein n=1 Tax=Ceutorhynchus assimilis TaxID=467358 RepID=A0A9N9N342_9CUCU|nr:unnamed protein product [Ceutorhynchus assimilis]